MSTQEQDENNIQSPVELVNQRYTEFRMDDNYRDIVTEH